MTYLIAGNGPAAVACVRAIREEDRSGRIVMVSPEANEPYSRITVPELMVGEIGEEDIYFVPGFYREYGVETRLGARVAKLRPEEHLAVLDSGEELSYDRLLLATGARPYLPDWADGSLKGMYTLWDKADAEEIRRQIRPGETAVIAGAGLVAFQAARALNAFGMKVTLAARRFIMSRQLDAKAAEILKNAAESCGVRVLLHTSVEEVLTENGAVTGVKLTGGETVQTGYLFVCMGTRPNLSMLDGVLDYTDGVETDDCMKTALEDVYAAGDIVKGRIRGGSEKKVRAIWPNAVEQGAVAGRNMAGVYTLFEGSRAMNSIELFGVSFISAGQTEAGPGQREVLLRNTPEAYHKLILGDGVLQGMMFAGEIRQAGPLAAKIGEPVTGYVPGLELISPDELT